MKISKEIIQKFESFQRLTNSIMNKAKAVGEKTIVGIHIEDGNGTLFEFRRQFTKSTSFCWIKIEDEDYKVIGHKCKNITEAVASVEKLCKNVGKK